MTTWLALAGNQRRGHVDGDFITYDDDSSGDSDVILRHLPSGLTVRIGDVGSVDFLNDLDGNRVAYTSSRTGNFDTWVHEFEIVDAQVSIDPASVSFGDVEIGTSSYAIVSITSEGFGDLNVTGVGLVGGGAGPFAIDHISLGGGNVVAPFVVSSGEMAEVTLRFAPGTAMPFVDTLLIETDDADQASVDVALSGNGVSTDEPPSEQIAAILEFFDTSVTDGDLSGSGNGNSANGRLGALRNMIEAASDLVDEGSTGNACIQLQDALNRTDGSSPPPDFVTGSAAAELAMRLEELIETLNCP
jgi:hypothetical protein